MRGLKICLWIGGILCIMSVFGVFLPISMLESFMRVFGVEAIPDSPMCHYALRVTSAMAVGMGVYFIILALDPVKYGILVPFTGVASVLLGIVCAITGLAVVMPARWFLGDSLSCLVLGVLILVFWQQVKHSRGQSTAK
jgi:hypothetical protein